MKRFLYSNCVFVQNELFMVGVLGGFLAKMNLDDNRIDYCDFMEGFIPQKKSVIIDYMDYYQNKVYALNAGEGKILVWDFERLEYEEIALGCCNQPWANFVAFERYQSDYYILPKYENKIIIFHTEKKKITEVPGYLDNFNGVQCACRAGNCIWILPEEGNEIYCYDFVSKRKTCYKLKKRMHGCLHAFYREDSIYILNMFGIIYRWDIRKKDMQEITLLETLPDKQLSVSRIVFAGNKLILLPAYGNEISILNMLTGKTEVHRDYPDDFYYNQIGWVKYYGYCEDETYYYFAECAGNYFLKIEKNSGDLFWEKPQISSLGGKTIELLKKEVIYENVWELSDFIKLKTEDESYAATPYVGLKIYCELGDR